MKDLEEKIKKSHEDAESGEDSISEDAQRKEEDWGENALNEEDKDPTEGPESGLGGHPDDTKAIEGDAPTLQDLLNISIQANGPLSNNEATTPCKIDTSRDTTTLKEGTSGDIFSEAKFPKGDILKGELKKVEAELAKIKGESKTKKVATDEPNPAFDEVNLAFVDIDPSGEMYSENKVKKQKKAKIKIVVMMDFSGSMGGYPAHAQRTLSLALNRLVKASSKMDITLIGTKVGNRTPIIHAVKLPANENDLIHSVADGAAEGITEGLKLNKERLKKADHVVFMTDGNVHGEELSRKSIREVIGKDPLLTSVYLGRHEIYSKKLEVEFDNFIFKPKLEEVIVDLVETFNMSSHKMKILKKENKEESIMNGLSKDYSGSGQSKKRR